MVRSIILTLIGPDRPGLIDAVAAAIADLGGNWLESRMAHLGGQFAGILQIDIPKDREASLQSRLAELEASGFTFVFRSEEQPAPAPPSGNVHLEIVAPDQPGIVSAVTRVLASRGVNIEEFQTDTRSAPMSGEVLFYATATLRLPVGLTAQTLQADLERISESLMADLTVFPGAFAPHA